MWKRYSPILSAFTVLVLSTTQLTIGISAHDVGKKNSEESPEVKAHRELDFGFPGFDKLNRELQRSFLTFSNEENIALAAQAASLSPPQNAHLVGTWSPAFSLPLVPIHVMVLTNGKVLMWDSVGDLPTEDYPDHDFTRAAIWDPVTNLVTNVDNLQTGHNIFCAGFAHLPDGTPFLAGGNLNAGLDGIRQTHYFNQTTNLWSTGPDMNYQRWYPSVTPLANGEMLITSGGTSNQEVYTTAGTIRRLSGFTLSMPLYPWLHAATNGKTLLLGPNASMYYINTSGTGQRSSAGWRVDGISRSYGSFAMFDIGRVVASGGASSRKESVIVDFRNPNGNPTSVPTADMNFGRRQHNLTVLPDGTVLASGGNSSGANLIHKPSNVYQAELWDPETGTWTLLSSASKIRQYHSTSILLPDGRVFTGGGGICGTCFNVNYLEKNMEIFTPPYLYDQSGSGELAPRPSITSAPGDAAYDETFFVQTPDAADIDQAVLMRVSSVTHSTDFEQRRVPLDFSETGGGLSVKAPANANIAPPGYYMLFILDTNGVPSVAKMIRLHEGSTPGAPLIVDSSGGEGNANLAWVPVPNATGYTIKYGTSPGVYTNTVDVGAVTTHALSNLSHWRHYFAITATTPGGVSGNSNEVEVYTNVVPTAAGVTVAGRIYSPNGIGINGVRITLESMSTGEVRQVFSNAFGYYSFEDVPAGETFLVTVSSKRASFLQPSIVITTENDLNGLDFVSQ